MEETAVDHAFTATDDYGTRFEPAYSGATSFLRRRFTKDLTGIDVAVTGIPLDTAVTNRPGTRFGPRAIREASAQIAWARPYGWNFDPLDRLRVIDYGDCAWDLGFPQTMPAAIVAHADTIIASGATMVSLGGDHFVSYPLLKAHAKKYGPLSLVHFDAHCDTWEDEPGNNRVHHGTMFLHAAKDGLVVPERSAQIGLRTHNDDKLGFNWLDAPFVHRRGTDETIAEIRRIVGKNRAYLTFDIDCLDPAFAPGTGTPVCGGLSTATALEILKGLAGLDFVGFDVVEVAPAYDVGQITALAGASIAQEFLALACERPGRAK
ncbi:MAG: agmatinase [Dongiaceae bacterium]